MCGVVKDRKLRGQSSIHTKVMKQSITKDKVKHITPCIFFPTFFTDMKTYFISGRAVPLADEMIYTTRGIGVRKHIPGLPAIGAAALAAASAGDKDGGLTGAAVTATSPALTAGLTAGGQVNGGTKTSKSAEPLESSCEGGAGTKMSQNKSFTGLLSPNGTSASAAAAASNEPTKSKSSFSLASKTYAMLSSSSSKLKHSVRQNFHYYFFTCLQTCRKNTYCALGRVNFRRKTRPPTKPHGNGPKNVPENSRVHSSTFRSTKMAISRNSLMYP